MLRVLFIDRDGTLVEEPADEQIDSIEKVQLVPDVIPQLLRLSAAGYHLVMVTNQDGLGTPSFPEPDFRGPHDFILNQFASQGIYFSEQFICPHQASAACGCRKPSTGLVDDFLIATPIDRERSFVIGDRGTDMVFAENLGLEGLQLNGQPGGAWRDIADRVLQLSRSATVRRATGETEVTASVILSDGEPNQIDSGIGFFDHMLEQLALHGGFSMRLTCSGDLEVDGHHTVEDVALTLGEALDRALGDRRGIGRYGFLLPMDESLAQVAVDLSGRPFCRFDANFSRPTVGELATEMVPHFFRSLSQSLRATIHVSVTGENTHHMIEAAFKGVGRALRPALAVQGSALPSSKGVL